MTGRPMNKDNLLQSLEDDINKIVVCLEEAEDEKTILALSKLLVIVTSWKGVLES